MNPNNSNHQPQNEPLLEAVERALSQGEASGNPLVDDLAGTVPQAKPSFEHALEERLLARLHEQRASERDETMQNVLIDKKIYPQQRVRRLSIPLTLAAAMMALLLAGILILTLNTPPGQPEYAAILQTTETETPLPTTISTVTPIRPTQMPTATPIMPGDVISGDLARMYVVAEGDTLLSIAQEFDISVERLLAHNCVTRETPLTVGSILTVPYRNVTVAIPPCPTPVDPALQQETQIAGFIMTATAIAPTMQALELNIFPTPSDPLLQQATMVIQTATAIASTVQPPGQQIELPPPFVQATAHALELTATGVPQGGVVLPTPLDPMLQQATMIIETATAQALDMTATAVSPGDVVQPSPTLPPVTATPVPTLVPPQAGVVTPPPETIAIIPPGMVALEIPVDQAVTFLQYAISPGDRVDILTALLFVDVDDEFQEIIPLPEFPDELVPQVVRQYVARDATFIGRGFSMDTGGSMHSVITMVVSPDEARVLIYLIEARVPLMVIPADTSIRIDRGMLNETPVVVALADIRRGTQITEDMLEVVYWPVESAPAEAQSEVVALAGQYAAQNIRRWQPVFASDVSPEQQTSAFEYGGYVTQVDSSAAIDAMHTAEMTWMKVELPYRLGDSTQTAAEIIEQAHQQGFSVLLNVVGNPAELAAGDEAYIRQFAEYLGDVAAVGPDAIEVWQAPNLDRHWPTQEVDGANYAALLRAAYDAIKARNADVIVISAAPAPTGAEAAFRGQVVNDDRFIRQMAEAGAFDYMDCMGMQYNEGVASPTATSGDSRDDYYTRYLTTMLDVYTGLAGDEMPLCITSLGYLTPDGIGRLPTPFEWAQTTTVTQQAEWIAEAVNVAEESGQVRLLIVWNVDFNSELGDDPQGGFAILRPDGSCPACEALAARD